MRLGYSLRNVPIDFVRADFLHTQALAARFLKSLVGTPYTVTVYTVVVHYNPVVVEEILKEAAFLIADTEQTKRFLLSIGISVHKIHLIRNGVPLEEFPPHRRPTVAGAPVILGWAL